MDKKGSAVYLGNLTLDDQDQTTRYWVRSAEKDAKDLS